MEPVEERTQITLALVFKDINKLPAAPSKIRYKLSDVNTDQTIIDATEVTPGATTMNVVITALQNAIINDSLAYETKLFSLHWYSGTTLLGTKQFFYKIKNNMKVPIPSPTP